jgi:nucleotide-binding universal stress UspA family protein
MDMSGGDGPVVVGVAGTHDTDQVVAFGAGEALLRRRPLRLVHAYVCPPPSVRAARSATAAARQAYQNAVAKLEPQRAYARQLLPGGQVDLVVRGGGRVEILLQEALDADLVVVGVGTGGQLGGSSGTLATQLAGYAAQPVLVVRGDRGPGRLAEGRVVVGLASSPPAAVLGAAFDEADLRGLDLLVVHAQGTEGHHGCSPGGEQVLAEALAGWRQRYPGVKTDQRLSPANAAAAVVAASRGADLLVVGDRGRAAA